MTVPNRQNGLPELVTVAEVAEWLHTTPKAVYAMHARGQLDGAIRIGRRLLFARAALARWVEQRRASSPEERR